MSNSACINFVSHQWFPKNKIVILKMTSPRISIFFILVKKYEKQKRCIWIIVFAVHGKFTHLSNCLCRCIIQFLSKNLQKFINLLGLQQPVCTSRKNRNILRTSKCIFLSAYAWDDTYKFPLSAERMLH